MGPGNSRKATQIKRIATFYNQAVNFFWSIINFAPLGYFCYRFLHPPWLYIFLISSLVPGFLPNSFFDFIQLGHTTAVYQKVGIRLVKKYTQDGDLINRLIRNKFPDYKPVSTIPMEKHLGKAYMNEKFHSVCFLFFLLSGLYAATKEYWGWAAVIGISNLIFNVYPIFLQQYNRIRFRQLIQRKTQPDPRRK